MDYFPNCEMCGCNNYEKRSGFYVCTNCDTQSQDVRDQSFGYVLGDGGMLDNEETELIIGKSVDQERQITSWECYNFILKGLVEELIGLGASSDLKIVTFKLWTYYLQKVEAAFTSKITEKLPKLPMVFKNSDAKILYGIDNLRKKLFKDGVEWRNQRKRKKVDSDASISNTNLSVCSSTSTNLRLLRRKQHLIPLPGFIILLPNLWKHASIAINSSSYLIPFINVNIPCIVIYMMGNVCTQYMCISSVYYLTTECSSLTVTLVITLRKFISLLFSIIYFNNTFTSYHWVGTLLVFIGTFIFSEIPQKLNKLCGMTQKKML